MKTLKTHTPWLDTLLPEGIPVPSSTLISGPGGTGKPLVEFAFISAWLKANGSLIAIPLQYPTPDLMQTAMKKLYNVDLKNYINKIAYIQFDPHTETCKKLNNNTVKANMVKPGVWDEAVIMAEKMIAKSDLGTMVFGSALNLLLFSTEYQNSILTKLKDIAQNDKSKTYAFAVSTSAFADKIKILEEAADNLMYTRVEKPMKLFFKISRMKQVKFSNKEVQVPISKEMLEDIRGVAESTRKKRIPEIRKIK
ncbi:MAG: ATPase domain-containing protein [bacterium]